MRGRSGWARRVLIGAGGAAALLIAGCDVIKPDAAADAAAKLAYQHLVRGEDDALEAMLAPEARHANDRQTFATLRGLIPPGQWRNVSTVGWRTYAGTGGRVASFTYSYDYGDNMVQLTAELVPAGADGAWMLRGFNVNTGIAPPKPAVPTGERRQVT